MVKSQKGTEKFQSVYRLKIISIVKVVINIYSIYYGGNRGICCENPYLSCIVIK